MKSKRKTIEKRASRVRAKMQASSERPRLSIYRSNTSLYAQIIDDQKHRTLVSCCVKEKSKTHAKELGKEIAIAAKAKGISKVIFDRGAYKYHGTIAELAQSAREGGLVF